MLQTHIYLIHYYFIFIKFLANFVQTIFSEPWDSSRWETLLERGDDWQRGEERISIIRTKSFRERLDPLLCEYFRFTD